MTLLEANRRRYELERERILRALGGPFEDGGAVWAIEHVGPGSLGDAEGCVHIALDAYPDPLPETGRAALEALGYHLAAEIPEEHTYCQSERQVTLHAVMHDSGRWEDLVLVRDYLRSGGEQGSASERLPSRARAWHVRETGFAPVEFLRREFEGASFRWLVASGWALDLHAGTPSRPHRDLDVTVPRAQQLALQTHLLKRGWRLDVSLGGQYRPWGAGETLELPLHQIHARQGGQFLDLMLSEEREGSWAFRRQPDITRAWEKAEQPSALGVTYLAPEIVLLFKSGLLEGRARRKDAQDFERTLPTLSGEARAWLRESLAAYRPGHSWLERL